MITINKAPEKFVADGRKSIFLPSSIENDTAQHWQDQVMIDYRTKILL